jgi:hypothetical protein
MKTEQEPQRDWAGALKAMLSQEGNLWASRMVLSVRKCE